MCHTSTKPKWSRDALYRIAGLEKGKVSGFFKPSARPKKHLPGDVLAAIAGALDTTVEYLVTGIRRTRTYRRISRSYAIPSRDSITTS